MALDASQGDQASYHKDMAAEHCQSCALGAQSGLGLVLPCGLGSNRLMILCPAVKLPYNDQSIAPLILYSSRYENQ